MPYVGAAISSSYYVPYPIIPLLLLPPWLAVWIGSTPLLTRVTTLGINQIRKTRPLKTHFIIGLILVLLGLALLDIPIHYFGIYSIDYLILNPLQPIIWFGILIGMLLYDRVFSQLFKTFYRNPPLLWANRLFIITVVSFCY